MKILAIETSCDDTCIAVLEIQNSRPSTRAKLGAGLIPHRNEVSGAGFKIRSNIVSSQVKLHAKYGGVYPSLAKREHQKNLPIVLKRALKEADNPKINLIAVTVGPGLEPCLWTGINFAKELAKKMKLPIVPVNHIEAHILANTINPEGEQAPNGAGNQPRINSSRIIRGRQLAIICHEIQQAIIDVLIRKTLKAAKDYKVKSIILGGGVAANEELRKQFKKKIKKELPNIQYLTPNIKFCTDNAIMIAVAGYLNRQKKRDWKKIKANANLRISEKAKRT